MAELTPVPAPRSPFIGWRGRAVSLVVVGILVAIVKPWGDDTPPLTVRPSPTAPPSAMPLVLEPVGRTYDPSAWGPEPTLGSWAIVTPRGATTLDFLDRADASPGPAASDPAAGGEPVVVSGPVVDLGTTDEVDAFAVVHPAGTTLATVRVWHFRDGTPPRRVDIGEVAPPWPTTGVTMVAQRTGGMAPAQVLPWAPGLYRLDVLVEPAGQPRSVMFAVRRGLDGGSAAPEPALEPQRGVGTFATATLRLLPDSANVWAAGSFLSGWHRTAVRRDCRVVDIWRATRPEDACWAVPLGRTDALGVNITDGRAVTAIALIGIDPLPGPAPVQAATKVDGNPGRAMVRAPDGGLPDGIYRLDAVSGGTESSSWYFEVGPIGRAVAGYYETSTSR